MANHLFSRNVNTISILLVVFVTLASCQRKDSFESGHHSSIQEFVVYSSEANNETRSTLAGNDVIWESNDIIAVFSGSNTKDKYTIKSGTEGSTTATFIKDNSTNGGTESFSQISDEESNNNPTVNEIDYQEISSNISYYPYSGVYGCVEEDDTYFLYVNLPFRQIYKENSFAQGVLPMVAFTSSKFDNNLYFKNVCGLLKLHIKGDFIISKLILKGVNNEKLSGSGIVTVSRNSTPFITLSENATSSVELYCSQPVSVNEGMDFIFVLPPIVFNSGAFIQLETNRGVVEKQIPERFTIARSKITELGTIDLSNVETTSEILSQLLSFPKYKCIHHDNFARANNPDEIGNNGIGNDVKPYEYFILGSDGFKVGIEDSMAVSESVSGIKGVKLYCVDAGTQNYKSTIIRRLSGNSNSKLAFNVIDNENYYYTTYTNSQFHVYKIIDGEDILIKQYRGFYNNTKLTVSVQGNTAAFFLNDVFVDQIPTDFQSPKSGLMFYSGSRSDYDDFFVEIDDNWIDTNFDDYVEQGLLDSRKLGVFETSQQPYSIQIVDDCTNGSQKALKFQLKYSDRINFGKYRTEVCPIRRQTKALDSWIFMFDILIPDSYISDYVNEQNQNIDFICQMHDSGPSINPPFCITITGSSLWCSVRGSNKKDVTNKEVVTHSFELGNVRYNQWQRYIIYLKEGYEAEHEPRTIVYVDGVKKVDTNHINSYNAPNYLKFGEYKPIWASKPTNVDERTVFFDNIRYIN